MISMIQAIDKQVIRLQTDYPNAVYDSSDGCFYYAGYVTHGPDMEGCIVGQAGRFVGLWDLFEEYSNATVSEVLGALVKTPEDQAALDHLSRVQSAQDDKTPWGMAG